MRATRRSLLQLPLLAVVAGCTTSPVVQGTPGLVPEPPTPTRSEGEAEAALWLEGLAEMVDALAAAPETWGADEVHTAWISALQLQTATHVSRVVAEDPVMGGPTAFPVPSPTAPAPALPATPEEVVAALTAEVAHGSDVLQAAIATAGGVAERLLYASIAAASTGGLLPGLPPVEGDAEPAPFDDPNLDQSLVNSLSHVRALLRALEVGLGHLPRSDALLKAGNERLDSARVLRNTLLEAINGDPPEVAMWELPNAMSTPEEIGAVWAALEANVLDALAVLAATGGFSVPWWDLMLAQVPWVHRWGGRLPHWPGWVATP